MTATHQSQPVQASLLSPHVPCVELWCENVHFLSILRGSLGRSQGPRHAWPLSEACTTDLGLLTCSIQQADGLSPALQVLLLAVDPRPRVKVCTLTHMGTAGAQHRPVLPAALPAIKSAVGSRKTRCWLMSACCLRP